MKPPWFFDVLQKAEVRESSFRFVGLSGLPPDLRTLDPVYGRGLERLVASASRHFERRSPRRPSTNLILGAPGAGKSHVAKTLGKACDADYQEYNLSQFSSPTQIIQAFDEIAILNKSRSKKRLVVFIDEFDVRVGGSSAVQYLIQPIYDGVTRDGTSIARTVFVFGGSYLQDEESLAAVQHLAFDADICRFVFDICVAEDTPESARGALHDLFLRSILTERTRSPGNPLVNVTSYLQRLEKLPDFLSRINGVVLELPDLSSPLDLTSAKYLIDYDNSDPKKGGPPFQADPRFVGRRRTSLAGRISDYVIASEKVDRHRFCMRFETSPWEASVAYKNMVLLERLWRVFTMLRGRVRDESDSVNLAREDLLYLCVVPLKHGLRSLEFLVGKLAIEKDLARFDVSAEDLPVVRMHVHDFDYHRHSAQVWRRARSANARIRQISAEGCVKLAFG